MRVLVTGGAGFIGSNTARHFAGAGHAVTVLDNLSRPGSARNLEWLRRTTPVRFLRADVRDAGAVRRLVARGRFEVVIHLAAQTAVTHSYDDPRTDFEINVNGTFNVLEAVRRQAPRAIVLYASTNKVYGSLASRRTVERSERYILADRPAGIPEAQPLDLHTPYGCSKGAADQYVLDYARSYGLRTVSFRQSCIYGPRQFGCEDQGWLAWFTIAHLTGRPLVLYGNGKQVRDVLHVEDLCRCYELACRKIRIAAGRCYNIGGGPANAISLLDLIGVLGRISGREVRYTFAPWRPSDQPLFVCDIRAAKRDLGWAPRIGSRDGIRKLYAWIEENLETIVRTLNGGPTGTAKGVKRKRPS